MLTSTKFDSKQFWALFGMTQKIEKRLNKYIKQQNMLGKKFKNSLLKNLHLFDMTLKKLVKDIFLKLKATTAYCLSTTIQRVKSEKVGCEIYGVYLFN